MTEYNSSEYSGIARPELFMGITSLVNARSIGFNFSEAGRVSGSQFAGQRYGRGEVGEFVLVEGQCNLLLGRVSEIRLADSERHALKPGHLGSGTVDAIGQIQLLGTIAMDSLCVTPGVATYPRLGDRIYAAPNWFLARLPQLLEGASNSGEDVVLDVGTVGVTKDTVVTIKPDRLFGRHCAILGATGGGKSWTTARLVEESIRHKAKVILIDATSEYREFAGKYTRHRHLGSPVNLAASHTECSLPPTSFIESDFISLFEPAGKVQGPKLRAAIQSLRLAGLCPALATNGYIKKIEMPKAEFDSALSDSAIAAKLEDPNQAFDITKLVDQLEQECVYPPNQGSHRWGRFDESSFSYCLSLLTRITGVLTSTGFKCVFQRNHLPDLTVEIDNFLRDDARLLRICLSGIAHEFNAREIIANVIGRHLLRKARDGYYRNKPTLLIVDEAHNFLGRHVGSDEYASRLDAFEIIAKEGRKYGLNLCLATQRPRDITEDVLSQMGTLIVHRLTNDRDREIVERACGEIDRSASAFLPNLRPGEAVVIGTDFPIPLAIQVREPTTKPISDGPDYQKNWSTVIPW